LRSRLLVGMDPPGLLHVRTHMCAPILQSNMLLQPTDTCHTMRRGMSMRPRHELLAFAMVFCTPVPLVLAIVSPLPRVARKDVHKTRTKQTLDQSKKELFAYTRGHPFCSNTFNTHVQSCVGAGHNPFRDSACRSAFDTGGSTRWASFLRAALALALGPLAGAAPACSASAFWAAP